MKKDEKVTTNEEKDDGLIMQILGVLKSIQYGYVLITIHDSKVVQIDKTEKVRLDGQKSSKPKGGDNG